MLSLLFGTKEIMEIDFWGWYYPNSPHPATPMPILASFVNQPHYKERNHGVTALLI